jgi:hypothetical protein
VAFLSDFSQPAPQFNGDFASRAAEGVEAVIEAGAALLVAQPWRVNRIIRGAESLSFDELAGEAARRRALPPSSDFNRALALAQLGRALKRPAFQEAWGRFAKPRDHQPPRARLPFDQAKEQKYRSP